MRRLLTAYLLVAALHHFASLEGITYRWHEQFRIWWLAWLTAGEG